VSLDKEALGGRQARASWKRWVFRWRLKVPIEWDSLILGGNELKTENARRANSVRTRGSNSSI